MATASSGAKSGRQPFRRTQVSNTERTISILLVFLIVAIGITIGIKGQHFDPDRFALNAQALSTTVDPVEGKAATLRATTDRPDELSQIAGTAYESESGENFNYSDASGMDNYDTEGFGHQSGGGDTARMNSSSGASLDIVGFPTLGETEHYNADSLYEKINGRAPAYLDFNFQQLRSRTFGIPGDDANYLDFFEFEMDTPVNAFGIFSLERDPEGTSVSFTDDGYRSEMGYFYRIGRFYVQIIASDLTDPVMQAAERLAATHAASVAIDNTGLDAARRLPIQDQIPGTMTYIQSNAHGQSFLQDVFEARYTWKEQELMLFVMVGETSVMSENWQQYRNFIQNYGTITEEFQIGDARLFIGEMFGSWSAIYTFEGELGGVVDAGDGNAAKAFVTSILVKKQES